MNEPAIVVEDLGKRFGDVVAVDGVNLTVPAGTVLGLLGPNGAGKTTTVRILTTILRPDSGRATVLGHDVASAPEAVRSTIGLAGQFAAVDGNLTGRENLRMVGQLTHQRKALIGPRADELLERFGLADAADRTVRTYSGGMRRRLDLAAALVHKPPVLFLDEPTTGLDPRGRNDLWAVIGELVADGMTLLLTTQYLEEAERLADRVMVIDGGRVIAEGTSEELKQRLGATILEVRLADPAAAERARAGLGAIGSSEVLDDGRTVAVTVTDPGRAVLAVVRSLDSAQLIPEALTIREPSLDDVFLQLTGHKAEAGSGAAEPGAGAGRGRKRGAA
ncbi:MAG TPA: ATP-binding cassette domain-containing protein [Acidimicrobiales bacterium]|nr:ATP-binding cassette domain-containing protein [Acidimicrobiales bacterium]